MFGRDGVYVGAGNFDRIEQGACGHAAVALCIIHRQAALVAKIDLPTGPVGIRTHQLAIGRFRCTPTRQHDTEQAARGDGPGGGLQNTLRGVERDRVRVIEQVPAGGGIFGQKAYAFFNVR